MECFGNAPDAQGMTVVPLPIPRGVRYYPMPVSLGEGGAVGICTGRAGGPLQNVIPWSGEAMVCDSGQEIDKIGIGSVGSGSSKVRSVSTAGQCSNARRSSLKCGGRGWVAVCRVRRGIAPESGRKW